MFQRARTQEQVKQRQQVIIDTAKTIFESGSYIDVTFTEISKETSFTRPTIYRYYKTREEILLDLLKQATRVVTNDFSEYFSKNDKSDISKQLLVDNITDCLCNNPLFLELLSLHFNVLEPNSRVEKVEDFKKEIFSLMYTLEQGLETIFHLQKENLSYLLITFLCAVYPLTNPVDVQTQAIKSVDDSIRLPKMRDLISQELTMLLS